MGTKYWTWTPVSWVKVLCFSTDFTPISLHIDFYQGPLSSHFNPSEYLLLLFNTAKPFALGVIDGFPILLVTTQVLCKGIAAYFSLICSPVVKGLGCSSPLSFPQGQKLLLSLISWQLNIMQQMLFSVCAVTCWV